MTEAPLDEIKAALLLRIVPVATVATSNITAPATPVAMPFIPYVPTSGVAYLEVHKLLPAEPEAPFIGFDSDVIQRGIFQVDAVMPDQAGEGPGLRLAKLVAARYPRGLSLAVAGLQLKILRPSTVAGAVKDGSWVRFPVSVPWQMSVR
jgi:hypothetical protein